MAHVYSTELSPLELYHAAIESEFEGKPSPSSRYEGGPALPALGHAVSGALGAAISTALTYPLAVVVTRLQVKKRKRSAGSISSAAGKDGKHVQEREEEEEFKSLTDAFIKITNDGKDISALYAGLAAEETKTILDSFLFFLAYNFLRNTRLAQHGPKARRLPSHEELLVGMLAGAFGRLWTTPLSNVVTRKQTSSQDSKSSAREIMQKIYNERGIVGFWSGYGATLILTLNPSLTFLLHETLSRFLVRRENRENPGGRATFIIAAASKGLASAITYPFSLAKARTQVEQKSATSATSRVSRTVFGMVARILRTEGILSLYSGLEYEVTKGFFSHGLTMLLKEGIHKLVIRTYYIVLKLLRRYPTPEAARTINKAVVAAGAAAGEGAKVVKQAVTGQKMSGGQAGPDEKLEENLDAIHGIYENAREADMDIVDEYVPRDDDDW